MSKAKKTDNQPAAESAASQQTAPSSEPAEQQEQQTQPLSREEELEQAAKVAAQQMMEALKASQSAMQKATEAETKAAQVQDQLLRLQAEFDNYRKRTTAERDGAREDGFADALKLMLPVLDNLERAIASGEADSAITQGVKMVYQQMLDTFGKKGLTEIDALGQKFDPHLHAAVMQEPCEDESKHDTIAEVMQKGYTYKDRVLRYSAVKVYM